MKKCSTFWAFSLVAVLFVTGCGNESLPENAIRVVVYDRGTDGGRTNAANNKWTQWIQEKVRQDLGLEVIFVPVSRWEEGSIQTTFMASGNPPDVMVSYDAPLSLWSEQDGLFDMAPYVDTLLPDVRAFLGEDPAMPGRELIFRNQDLQSGKLLSIRAKRSVVAMSNIWMRKDWLDALGLPVPTTHEEFFNTLVAFKDRNPAGVDGVIPWEMSSAFRGDVVNITESFIDPTLSPSERWVNTVAGWDLLLPGFKEGIRFFNRMYNAGLIDPDFPLYADNIMPRNLISSGRVGAFGLFWDGVFSEGGKLTTDLQANFPNAKWIAIDAFPSLDGITHKPSHDPASLSVFIPKSSKNPEGAMRYINWLAKFENYSFLQIGPEGIVHEIVDSIPKINPNAGSGWFQNSTFNVDLTPLHNGMFPKTEEEKLKALALAYPFPPEDIMQAYNVAMNNARPSTVIQPVQPLVAEIPVAPTLNQQGGGLLLEAITTSPENFDSVWDAGITKWLSSGAQSVVDERRANLPAD